MLRGDSVELLSKAMNEMEITAIGQLSPWRVKQMNKDTVCDLLYEALRYLEEFCHWCRIHGLQDGLKLS